VHGNSFKRIINNKSNLHKNTFLIKYINTVNGSGQQTWLSAGLRDMPAGEECHRASWVSATHCSSVPSHHESELVPRSAAETVGDAVAACMKEEARSWRWSMPGWSVLPGRRTLETSQVAVDLRYSLLYKTTTKQLPRSITSKQALETSQVAVDLRYSSLYKITTKQLPSSITSKQALETRKVAVY